MTTRNEKGPTSSHLGGPAFTATNREEGSNMNTTKATRACSTREPLIPTGTLGDSISLGLLLGLVVCLAILLTGCGSDDGGKPDSEPATAEATTAEATTAEPTTALDLNDQAVGYEFTYVCPKVDDEVNRAKKTAPDVWTMYEGDSKFTLEGGDIVETLTGVGCEIKQ